MKSSTTQSWSPEPSSVLLGVLIGVYLESMALAFYLVNRPWRERR